MDIIKELYDMQETVGQKIADANKKLHKAGGAMDMNDIEIVDKLAHSMKSLVSTCKMLEAEEDGGYSKYAGPVYHPDTTYGYSGRRGERRDDGYSREGRDGYSGNNGGYSRNGYSRENRNGYGYSRTGDMTEQLRQMMDDAPDEMTRMEIKKLVDKMENQR